MILAADENLLRMRNYFELNDSRICEKNIWPTFESDPPLFLSLKGMADEPALGVQLQDLAGFRMELSLNQTILSFNLITAARSFCGEMTD